MQTFLSFLNEQKLTLQYHEELNPSIWKNEKINDDVRKHLLKIAETWRVFSNIPVSAVKDILLTGGNANYNYTKYSDLDVHLFVDKRKLKDCDAEIMDDYLRDKKSLWTLSHDIKVKGYDVEMYAQGIDEKTSSDQGVFSLKNNEWVKHPKKTKINLKDAYLLRKIKSLISMIEHFIASKCDNIEKMEAFKEKIRKMRGSSVQKGGEFSLENLAFKEIRNKGYLEKFSNYIKNVQDRKLSLK